MAMSKEERLARKLERKAQDERLRAATEKSKAIVATGKCPQCESPLRRNLAITGWFQCAQFGADGFRADSSKPACSFQCFTS